MKAKKTTAKKKPVSVSTKENHCPVPSGILVVIGGKENKGEVDETKQKGDFEKLGILKAFKDVIAKKNPRVEVVTTSSSVGEESFRDYKKAFGEIGIENIGHIHHNSRREVLEDSLIERIRDADAFFFSGGDQLKLSSNYGGTEFLSVLKDQYIHGKIVIGGTSAGAMAMSTPMIYAGNEEVQQLGGEIKVTTGLEFLKDVCIDTHFVKRGRFIRMAQVVVTNPSCIGVGIEEDTALIVKDGSEVRVIGSGVVTIIEGFKIMESSISDFTSQKPVTIRDLRVHLLSNGDQYRIPQLNPPHK